MQAAPASWLRGYPERMLAELNASRGRWKPQFVHRFRRNRRKAFGSWNAHDEPEHMGFVPVEAFWFTGKKRSPKALPRPRVAGQPVALMFHGGGYLSGTAAETGIGTNCIAKQVVDQTLIRHVLSVDYRLAHTAPWPLPLLDAITAYHHAVVVEGIAEGDLIIGGDSAGGHLAHALVRWLRDEGPALGLSGPRGLLLLSPWSDIGFTHQYGPDGWHHNRLSDTIDDSFGPYASSVLTRAMRPTAIHEDVYLAPASRLIKPATRGPQSFERFPPTFVVYGGAERISREIIELYTRLQTARAVDPTPRDAPDVLHCEPEGIHDFTIFPHFAEEATEAFAHVNEWLRVLLPDSRASSRVSSRAGSQVSSRVSSRYSSRPSTALSTPQRTASPLSFAPDLPALSDADSDTSDSDSAISSALSLSHMSLDRILVPGGVHSPMTTASRERTAKLEASSANPGGTEGFVRDIWDHALALVHQHDVPSLDVSDAVRQYVAQCEHAPHWGKTLGLSED